MSKSAKSAAKKRKQFVDTESVDTTKTVYLPSITPPRLTISSDLHGVVTFMDRFRQYEAMGGSVQLRQCLDPVILQTILLSEPSCDVTQDDQLEQALFKRYCPSDITVTLSVLKDERPPSCDSMKNFNRYKKKGWRRRRIFLFQKSFGFLSDRSGTIIKNYISYYIMENKG